MKLLFTILAATLFAFAASANSLIYSCGIPKNNEGLHKMYSHSYKVQFKSNGKVFLFAIDPENEIRQTRIEMDLIPLNILVSSSVDARTYAAGKIQINWVNGLVILIEDGEFYTTCGLQK